jgi:phosphoribosylamine---glycine ligase
VGARVLLVGMGGREHAIAWKLSQSNSVDEVFVAPGNGGTSDVATNVDVKPKDIDGLVKVARDLRIDFYLASMDDPQPLGLVDRLRAEGILCYGPTRTASQIEASKAWAKRFMEEHGIATAEARIFDDSADAKEYLAAHEEGPIVVKASGLAAGKGALVCENLTEAQDAVRSIMDDRAFGASGDTVVIEEFMEGWETSAHAFCDGTTAVLMPSSVDYKRARTGAEGLNTGGMGAYSPYDKVTLELTDFIRESVVDAAMSAMSEIGAPYNGTLYPGLMVTQGGVKVVEFNARFGDPEAQILIPRLESDLFEVCRSAAAGGLSDIDINWSKRPAVGVVLASGGYPEEYATGHPIHGLDDVDDDVLVFHAGSRREDDGTLVTSGGRVLTVVGMGDTLAEARARAYDNIARISFKDSYFRTDIAEEAAQ